MIKGKNYRYISMIAESIAATIDTAKSMEQQAAADKSAQAALVIKISSSYRSKQYLLQNLAAAMRCKYTD